MKQFTKESLIAELHAIKARGWIPNARPGNSGGVGNTLEDLLGIEENNLPLPNAAEWELKCQRSNTTSLVTLFHMEPSPTAMKLVPSLLLPNYGWSHKSIPNEMSFRQTITGAGISDRGFTVRVNREQQRVEICFDPNSVANRHANWLKAVGQRVRNLDQLDPQPYWGFEDLMHKAGTKLPNTFFIQADVGKEGKIEYFAYNRIMQLQSFDFTKFLAGIEQGNIFVDFDARTGHNHGTKFRLRVKSLPNLFKTVLEL